MTYDSEGRWRCTARNIIKGQERVTNSQEIRIEVSGRPLPLLASHKPTVEVALGQDAMLAVSFCADPPPRSLTWEWGSLSLEDGQFRGRFTSLKTEPNTKKNCYTCRLEIRSVERPDERTYYLLIDNGSGVLRSGVRLSVKDPVSMVTVLAISISVLVIIVFCCICTVAMRRRRSCCFRRKQHFHQHDNIRFAICQGCNEYQIQIFKHLNPCCKGKRKNTIYRVSH